MRKSPTPIEPVIKVREIGRRPEAAFELFTADLDRWWPLQSHSIGASSECRVRFEGRVGGRVIETTPDGAEHAWADVIAWDPPHRFVVAWHPTPDPVAASILEVTFTETDDGCRLRLEHRGWEELGAEAGQAARLQYEPGWDGVLGHYVDAASGPEAAQPASGSATQAS